MHIDHLARRNVGTEENCEREMVLKTKYSEVIYSQPSGGVICECNSDESGVGGVGRREGIRRRWRIAQFRSLRLASMYERSLRNGLCSLGDPWLLLHYRTTSARLLLVREEKVPLLSGSSGFGSRKRYCNPTITALRFRTGFQSSRRMLRQTFPSRSRFG